MYSANAESVLHSQVRQKSGRGQARPEDRPPWNSPTEVDHGRRLQARLRMAAPRPHRCSAGAPTLAGMPAGASPLRDAAPTLALLALSSRRADRCSIAGAPRACTEGAPGRANASPGAVAGAEGSRRPHRPPGPSTRRGLGVVALLRLGGDLLLPGRASPCSG